ncbi:MAG: OmpA family protein [Thiotrichales bacterium]
MLRLLLLVISLAGFVYLAYFSAQQTGPFIANDLEERSLASLQFRSLHDLDIDVEGQTITVKGVARNKQEHELALQTLHSVWGVRRVIDQLAVFKPVPYELIMDFDGSKVLLSGYLPSEADRENLHNKLENGFGKGNITDTTEIADGAPANLMEVLDRAVLPGLQELKYGSMTLRNEKLEINGELQHEQSEASLKTLLQTNLPERFTYELIVETPKNHDTANSEATAPPPKSLPAAKTEELKSCQNELTGILSENKLEFISGKTRLTSTSQKALLRISKLLLKCQPGKIRIIGYTDSRGSAKTNEQLSRTRAETVAKQLIRLGVPEKTLVFKGLGESRPVASNKTAEGRAKNRRIEITLN